MIDRYKCKYKESIKNMSDGWKRILNPSTWRKKRKAGNKTGVRYMSEERR